MAYKGGKCVICGYDACESAFDFHHVDALEKDFNISDRMTSFEAIRSELDKTVLVCCRCHREIHDGLHPGYLELDARGGWDDSADFEESDLLVPVLAVPMVLVEEDAALLITEGKRDVP